MIRMQNGDESAFEELYTGTSRGLFTFLLSILKNYHTAEDVMQNTYIRVKKSIATYKEDSNALAWLYTIAKNLAFNEIEKQKRLVVSDFSDNPNLLGDYSLQTNIESPIFDIMQKTLKEQELQIVSLHLLSGFKHKEIAVILNKPLGTVLWAYRNALNKLKIAMEKEREYEKTRY